MKESMVQEETIGLDVYVPKSEHQAAQTKGDITARRNGVIYYNNIVGKFNNLPPEIERSRCTKLVRTYLNITALSIK